MAVYLIDFENVNSSGLSGVEHLSSDDKVYIFYTANASSLSFSAHLKLLACPAEVTYYNVESGGKNALDFQLSSFLGYLISSQPSDQFCIISGDRGFECIKSFWQKMGAGLGINIISAASVKSAVLPVEQSLTIRIRQDELKAIPGTAAPSAAETENTEYPDEETSADRTVNPQEVIPEASPKPSKKKKKTDTKVSVPKLVKNALTKAGLKLSYDEIGNVIELVTDSSDKQQFYRGCLKAFGKEKGLEIYKSLSSEFKSISSLIEKTGASDVTEQD